MNADVNEPWNIQWETITTLNRRSILFNTDMKPIKYHKSGFSENNDYYDQVFKVELLTKELTATVVNIMLWI